MDAARPATWSKFTRFRGDTKSLPFVLTDDLGNVLKPSEHTLYFSANDEAGNPLIQKQSTIGSFTVTDDNAGKFELELVPADDAGLADGTPYACVILAQHTISGAIHRLRATLTLSPAILPAPEITRPIYTSNPPINSGADPTIPVVAGVTVGSGRFLAIASNGTAIYANASTAIQATGFTREAVTVGNSIAFRESGALTGLSGLTPGAIYYLSAVTPGFYTSTPPTNGIVQRLGTAMSADTLLVGIEPPTFLP